MGWLSRLFFSRSPEPVHETGIPDDWAIPHQPAAIHMRDEEWLKDIRQRELECQRDKEFCSRMERAMDRFWENRAANRWLDDGDPWASFVDLDEPDLRVTWLRERLLPCDSYGVHFKDTDDYGVCELFRHDNGDVSTSYKHCTDDTFGASDYLADADLERS